MKTIGLLHHPKIPKSQVLAREMAAWLDARGVQAWLGSAWDKEEVCRHVADFDLVVTLGGDGTILRAARAAAQCGVPILGLNLGRLGFLAEMDAEGWQGGLSRILAGEYWLEERMMLHTELWHGGEHGPGVNPWASDALNDVVISRHSLARVVRLATHINGGYLTTYTADGLIASTPTGSTAYALAVGGPILPPQLKNILLIPIAPHLSMDRAIVLPQGATVKVQVSTDHRAILTVDGQFHVELEDADEVVVKASPHPCRFVRMGDRSYFYRTLMKRLMGSMPPK